MSLPLTPADVAELSGFSLKTVRRAIQSGDLVASRVRNTYRVWPADYRAWIDCSHGQSAAGGSETCGGAARNRIG